MFPSHKSVIVKLGPPETEFEVVNVPPPQPVVPQGPRVRVSFRDGLLKVWAEKATLAEVLNEIHHQTGADIAIPSGAEQDQVIANYGPGPAEQVIAALLNGSRFNFVTVGAPDNPAKISSVILIPRTGGVTPSIVPAPYQQHRDRSNRLRAPVEGDVPTRDRPSAFVIMSNGSSLRFREGREFTRATKTLLIIGFGLLPK